MSGGGSLEIFPLADYPDGTRVLGPRTIPGAINSITFAVARRTSADLSIFADPASTIRVSFDLSYDGGTTWNIGAPGITNGGIAPGRHGVGELAESSWTCEFLGPQPVTVRMNVTTAGGPIRTSGTLRWA